MNRFGLYWSYSTRSLARGGQRTLLAIFCVAVGVMAIVSLQIVANTFNSALTSNVRDNNGGDIAVNSDLSPLSQDQVGVFDTLKSQGTISNYTAIVRATVNTRDAQGNAQRFTLNAIDPGQYPLSGAPTFVTPSGGSFSSLLTGDNMVVTQKLADRLHAHIGDNLTLKSQTDGRVITGVVKGIIATQGFFNSAEALFDIHTYMSVPSPAGFPVTYSEVYANVPGGTDAHADAAKKVIEQQLPLATVTTTKDALSQNAAIVQNVRYFLQIVGLLALLIGGVGIINTMQVLLRRRRVEIAMLKTAGYRRFDLYTLFGLEAALLGLAGGVVGALAGVGVSYVVSNFVQRVLPITLTPQIDVVTVIAGVVIGLATALIFGLMPIVQAGQVRPLSVLRDMPENTGTSVVVSIVLAALLAALFFGMATIILGNVVVSLFAVVGTGIFLALLSGIFTLVVFLIGKLPVLESFRWWYVLMVGVATLIAVALTLVVPSFGVLLLALSLLGFVVVALPREWKSNVRMALRNLSRQRARTVTTLVALFIGVFAIGLVLALGQNVKDEINKVISTSSGQFKYNAYVFAGNSDKSAVDAQLQQTSGIQAQTVNTGAGDVPLAVNGTPFGQLVQNAGGGGRSSLGKDGALAFTSAVQGYDLAGQAVPGVQMVVGRHDAQVGRNLNASDAGTNNVVLPSLTALDPLNLKLGDQLTLLGQDRKSTVTVTVVGFYAQDFFTTSFGYIYSDNSVTQTLSAGKPVYFYSLKIASSKVDAALKGVEKAAPGAQTFNLDALLVSFTDAINSFLNNFILLLSAIASLALIAGIIIIANAVALAMLERRRELGILKAVGYTSNSVLSEVLMENGIVGFAGALLAMLLTTLALSVLGRVVFKLDFGTAPQIVLGIMLSTMFICMIVAGLVASGSTRVRPLEVLRYE